VLKKHHIDSVLVTSTNLSVKFSPTANFIVVPDGQNNLRRHSSEYIEHDEALILTPDKETYLYGHYDEQYGSFLIIPIILRNQQKGFSFIVGMRDASFQSGFGRSNIAYVVLNDVPVEVDENDVEMIMVGGEWKPWEEIRPFFVPMPAPKTLSATENMEKGEQSITVPEAEPELSPVIASKVEQSNPTPEQNGTQSSPTNYLWLYVIIAFGILAIGGILYLRRKK